MTAILVGSLLTNLNSWSLCCLALRTAWLAAKASKTVSLGKACWEKDACVARSGRDCVASQFRLPFTARKQLTSFGVSSEVFSARRSLLKWIGRDLVARSLLSVTSSTKISTLQSISPLPELKIFLQKLQPLVILFPMTSGCTVVDVHSIHTGELISLSHVKEATVIAWLFKTRWQQHRRQLTIPSRWRIIETVNMSYHLNQCIFWDSRYAAGSQPGVQRPVLGRQLSCRKKRSLDVAKFQSPLLGHYQLKQQVSSYLGQSGRLQISCDCLYAQVRI